MLPDAFYEPDGNTFVPTQATVGPWRPDAQHAGPPSALLGRAIEGAASIHPGQTARITFDILRPVPLVPLRAEARVVRGGKRVEQLEATLTAAADGAELMRARAWRVRTTPVELPDGLETPDPPPPGPEGLFEHHRPAFWEGDVVYWDAFEWRRAAGNLELPGPATYWTRLRIDLVDGERATPYQHLLAMADAASGISAALDWLRFTFVNVDYSVALERQPVGEWLAMDAVTRAGTGGAGVCTAVLSDAHGRIGSSSQALVVTPL